MSYRNAPMGPTARYVQGGVRHGRVRAMRSSSSMGSLGAMVGIRAPVGGVSLARFPGAGAYGDVGARYEGRAPVYGRLGNTQPTSWQWADQPASKPKPQKSGGPTAAQIGDWLTFGIQTAQQLGVRVSPPMAPQGSAGAGVPSPPPPPGPTTSGYTVGTTTVTPPTPTPKKKVSGWVIGGVVIGAVILGAGASYARRR